MKESLFIVGGWGAGKTTVGRLPAEHLGSTCHDTDEMICESAGCPISEIFKDHGWPQFREDEFTVPRQRGC